MKISINVIPDGEKEKLKEEKKIGFALKMALSFIAVLLLVNAVLFLMQIVLGIEYQAAKKPGGEAPPANSGRESSLEKNFNQTNKEVSSISKINASIPNWARVLVRVSEMCPDGVRVTRLSADGNQLAIAGFSKTRDDFLYFQNKLMAEGFQFSIDLSNLVASQNFNFDLDVGIPQDYLIRK